MSREASADDESLYEPWLKLPPELFLMVISHFDVKALCHCSQVSRNWRYHFEDNRFAELIWKDLFKIRWGYLPISVPSSWKTAFKHQGRASRRMRRARHVRRETLEMESIYIHALYPISNGAIVAEAKELDPEENATWLFFVNPDGEVYHKSRYEGENALVGVSVVYRADLFLEDHSGHKSSDWFLVTIHFNDGKVRVWDQYGDLFKEVSTLDESDPRVSLAQRSQRGIITFLHNRSVYAVYNHRGDIHVQDILSGKSWHKRFDELRHYVHLNASQSTVVCVAEGRLLLWNFETDEVFSLEFPGPIHVIRSVVFPPKGSEPTCCGISALAMLVVDGRYVVYRASDDPKEPLRRDLFFVSNFPHWEESEQLAYDYLRSGRLITRGGLQSVRVWDEIDQRYRYRKYRDLQVGHEFISDFKYDETREVLVTVGINHLHMNPNRLDGTSRVHIWDLGVGRSQVSLEDFSVDGGACCALGRGLIFYAAKNTLTTLDYLSSDIDDEEADAVYVEEADEYEVAPPGVVTAVAVGVALFAVFGMSVLFRRGS